MMTVEVLEKKLVYDFQKIRFRVEEVRFRHTQFNGDFSPILTRVTLDRGEGAAALLYNPQEKTVLLIEQFRYPTYEHGYGWLLELPAGIVNPNESPEQTMRRELVEETGYHLESLEHITTCFLSPGGSSERIFIYYGEVTASHHQSAGGGLAQEGENIRSLYMPIEEALQAITDGKIVDAKTIIGLQWLALKLKTEGTG